MKQNVQANLLSYSNVVGEINVSLAVVSKNVRNV